MTIVEALKSGKRFKRPSWKEWELDGNLFIGGDYGLAMGPKKIYQSRSFALSKEDLIADDYFIDERKIELTRDVLKAACARAQIAWTKSSCSPSYEEILATELGL